MPDFGDMDGDSLTNGGAHTNAVAQREKRSAAVSSVAAAVFLTGMKLVVGLITGSLGILSEAAHSGLDLVAALVTFVAVRVSDRPADEHHQFGHGKVENLSALVETLLLFVTCVWIIYEAVQRLFFKHVAVDASIWAFAVMGTSIIVDFTRSRVLMKAAKAHRSQALEADALHFSTDIWSSSVVILGLAGVRLGKTLEIEWLAKADAGAALIVALIVIYVSGQLGRRAVAALLDTAPAGLSSQLRDALQQIPSVREVRQLRVREAGPRTFVDLVVAVDPDLSVMDSHRVASQIEKAVMNALPDADVMVHVEGTHTEGEDWPAQVRAAAAPYGLRVHGLHAHEISGRLSLHLHVEVSDTLTLEEAHARVTAFEQELHRIFGPALEVVSHIEPAGASLRMEAVQSHAMSDEEIKLEVQKALAGVCSSLSAHDIHVFTNAAGEYDLTLHCKLAGEMSIVDAHQLSDQAEESIRKALPQVRRVLIHLEPA
ncbi:MAG: cation diffusion facilitator family transporter [Anaerolineae bacterium]